MHSTRLTSLALAMALIAPLLSPAPTVAAPAPQSGSASSTPPASVVESATNDPNVSMIIKLQDRIDRNREYTAALSVRIQVMNRRIFLERAHLSDARAARREAEQEYGRRMVDLYKNGSYHPIMLLLTSSSFSDLYRRITMLSRLTTAGHDLLVQARLAEQDASFKARALEDMKRELVSMRKQMRERLEDLKNALGEERILARRLNSTGRGLWKARVAATSRSREQWRASSIRPGLSPGFATAVVQPYPEPYLVASYQPKRYRKVSAAGTLVCSWYGNEFNGRPTASGQIFNENDFTCAHKSLPFGTRLALRRGTKRIVVVVNDRGPFVAGRDLDLSKAAARALGYSGVATVQADFVETVR